MKVIVSLMHGNTELRALHWDYSSDEALGEVCGILAACAREHCHSAQDITITVKFLEPFPAPLRLSEEA
jgi:hypothetical protein